MRSERGITVTKQTGAEGQINRLKRSDRCMDALVSTPLSGVILPAS